ncbi:hypothetical protein [Fulvivirga sediminis]|uniref:NigD-like C-terminal beta sandwich domain-containing protein n=1 Tax=Fulvivirga sediminis TaxID=2803949 RepID=A0A937F793_9BACT|nr:hypothetical protein [Fulvivirga sediminis]MBL3655620.1 hypothetical protein [Fulvivirga sediminis]
MRINSLLLFLFIGAISISCFNSPDFPDTPSIEFQDVEFKRVGGFTDPDSLVISLRFEDGNGDLGLDGSESNAPFNNKNYFSNKTGQFFNFGLENAEDLLTYADRATIDSLPAYSGDAICFHWDISPDIYYQDGSQLEDTVYFQFNRRYYNIFIEFLVNEDGEFKVFDWQKEIDCSSTFDGRFPVLTDDVNRKNPLEGSIRYSMTSIGFEKTFEKKPLKLRVYILDRAGNQSNTIETPEFTLESIIK